MSEVDTNAALYNFPPKKPAAIGGDGPGEARLIYSDFSCKHFFNRYYYFKKVTHDWVGDTWIGECIGSIARVLSGISHRRGRVCLRNILGGTWMVPRVGQLRLLEKLRTWHMRSHVPGLPRVAFAGGDVSSVWPGWMEGAVASARRVASDVVQIAMGVRSRETNTPHTRT
jgi:hypothetical protein